MKFQEIKNRIFYCGINDCERKIFDELIPLEHGTTYNSYLVKGSEKTAIIDANYPPKADEYLKNLEDNGVKSVDYIIANHGEQDHTGVLPKLLEKYPNAKVVTNQFCKNNIMEMVIVPDDKFIVVKNSDELSLGDKTLKFYVAPGVHWPDTMFTHIVEDNLLCTCDFLGAHLTFEDVFAVEGKELEHSAKRYYAEIMMPFRKMVQKYVKQVREINPDMVLPSHGPVYTNPDFILKLYEDWSSDEAKNLVVLPYVSMYGSVEEMIDYLINKLNNAGIETLKYDIIRGDLGDLAMALVDAKTIVLGSSMVLASPHPAAANIAYLANVLNPKAKFATIIGSYGWGGDLINKLAGMLSNLKLEIIEPILVKGKAKQDTYEKLDVMADTIIEKHKTL